MPEEQPNIQIVQQAPKTWKDRGIEWFFQQGTTVVVLMVGVGWLGYVQWKQLPERDAAWAKVIASQADSFANALEDRDKRFIEYRAKSEERYAKTITELIAKNDKDYDRLERLLTSRINDVQRNAEKTAAKVETLMP